MMNKYKLYLFLVKHGGFETADKVLDFIEEQPQQAQALALKIYKELKLWKKKTELSHPTK